MSFCFSFSGAIAANFASFAVAHFEVEGSVEFGTAALGTAAEVSFGVGKQCH